MKSHTKAVTKCSITLPPEEAKLVLALQTRLKARSRVEVVRRGLRLLQEATDREMLREGYRRASLATRPALQQDLEELDIQLGDLQGSPGRHWPRLRKAKA